MSNFDKGDQERRQENRAWMTGALDLPPGEHLCLFYDDPAEQAPALVPFLRQGLDRGERVIYVSDDTTTNDIRQWLFESGVDTQAAEGSGSLRLLTRAEWREPGDADDSDQKAAQVRSLAQEARDDGFPGVRFGIEMNWSQEREMEADHLCRWEATINTSLEPELNARIICQYSTRRLKPEALHAALRSHPTAIIGAEVCPNPYYEAPIILRGGSDAERAEWTAARLRRSRAVDAERERRIREQVAQDEALRNQARFDELYRLADDTSERLRVASAAKDEFLALISHELRTPLTMILGNAEVLHRHGDSLDGEERASAIEDLHLEAQRLSSIVEHLLIVSRIENGESLETEPVLPARVLVPFVERYRVDFGRLVSVSGDPSVGAWGSRNSVTEVLENLLGNAHQYSPPGQSIEVDIHRDAGECVISVKDRGIGLLDDELAHLFEPFYRSPRVAETQTRGLGIGLAACRRIAEAHRGRIWAEQRPGGGSVFSFALPFADLGS